MNLSVYLCLLATFSISCHAQTLFSYYPLDGKFENEAGSWKIEELTPVELTLFGVDLAVDDEITFTTSDSNCNERADFTTISSSSDNGTAASVMVTFSTPGIAYFCINAVHQADVTVNVQKKVGDLIPLGGSIFLIILLLFLSGLFSGLNLGLMSLDPNDLAVLAESGDDLETKYARIILPLRKRGNLLLCTVLLGNVLVNSTLTIFLDGLAGGLGAVLGSTAGIVIFGEIVPQSVCSRHALAVGAKTIWITRFFLLVTFPIAYPISIVLDYVLGDEVGAVYMRKQLLHLLEMQNPYNDLGKDEFGIIRGALTYKAITAKEVMTNFEDVFMLDINSVLDFKTVSRIMDSGHSRIPTYKDSVENIVGLLYVKDLAFIDPDDKTPLESVIKYYKHPIEEMYSDATLDVMLDLFKQGRTHMVLVIEIDSNVEFDPVRKIVGIATLEDVIEEIIQDEIIDETDRVVDNKTKKVVHRENSEALPPSMLEKLHQQESLLSDQVTLAVLSFLSSSVDLFAEEVVSRNVLRKLIGHPKCITRIDASMDDEMKQLYTKGEKSDKFTLIIEGHVKITVGEERFVIDGGPFHHMGLPSLTQANYVADFDAVIKSSEAVLLQIPRSLYQNAVSTSKRVGDATPVLRHRELHNVDDEVETGSLKEALFGDHKTYDADMNDEEKNQTGSNGQDVSVEVQSSEGDVATTSDAMPTTNATASTPTPTEPVIDFTTNGNMEESDEDDSDANLDDDNMSLV